MKNFIQYTSTFTVFILAFIGLFVIVAGTLDYLKERAKTDCRNFYVEANNDGSVVTKVRCEELK